MEKSKVYILTNVAGYITRCDGGYSGFQGGEGWLLLDEGEGDRFNLCQSHYFPLPLMTEGGAWQYRLEGGAAAECSGEDIAAQEAEIAALPRPQTDAERIAELEAALELLLSGVTE